jgi:hypothetical protein
MQNVLSISNSFLLNEHLPATLMRSVLSRGLVSLLNPDPSFDKIRGRVVYFGASPSEFIP